MCGQVAGRIGTEAGLQNDVVSPGSDVRASETGVADGDGIDGEGYALSSLVLGIDLQEEWWSVDVDIDIIEFEALDSD